MNTSKEEHSTAVRDEALAFAAEGIRVFPCRANDKRPAVNDWPNVASADELRVKAMFGRPSNLGVRCGPTTVGVDIFVVDIDIKDDQPGEKSWADFCDEHPEVRAIAERTVSVTTPSGGWHFYFAVPEGYECPRNSNPWPGVDIRGDGGYVLAPPSTLPNGSYVWTRDLWEPNEGIMYAPPALVEALLRPAPVAEVIPINRSVPVSSLLTHPSNVRPGDDNPIDWAKDNFSVYEWLLRHGWQGGQRRGQQEEVTRPGKSRRDGTSATVHHDTNIVNVHTSTIPAEFMNVGKPTSNGGFTINGFDAWMIENGILDSGEAMSAIRRQLMPQQVRPSPPAQPVTEKPEDHSHPEVSFNLPDEFWLQRPWLTHVRDAAWCRMLNPTAVLGAVLVRAAARISPQVQLPDVIGSTGTFDLFVTLVGDPGSGKSTAWSCAKDLVPVLGDKVVDDLPLGTGEGLVERLYARVDENGELTKKGGERALFYKGVCIMVNEGKGINEQAARTGSIIIETLCSAWMGETLGQSNASEDTFRHVPAKKARVAACLGIQTENAPLIFRDKFRATGFPQRMVALWAHPDFLPEDDDMPAWPGVLGLPRPAIVAGLTVFTADPEIYRLIRSERRHVALRQVHLDELDTHIRLTQLKLAGIFTANDGETHITTEHWALAETVLDSHRALRTHIAQVYETIENAKRVTVATRQAETQMVAEDHIDKALVARCVKSIKTQLDRQGTWTEGKLKNRLGSRLQPYLEMALEMLEVTGEIQVDGGTITKVPS